MVNNLSSLLCNNDLAGKRILITAGPTHEKLDAVRFIGNYSTGKMGFALAESCANRGAEVELIAGPVELTVDHPRIHRTDVVSAFEMFEAATSLFPSVDAGILCAAVADFTLLKRLTTKSNVKEAVTCTLEASTYARHCCNLRETENG